MLCGVYIVDCVIDSVGYRRMKLVNPTLFYSPKNKEEECVSEE